MTHSTSQSTPWSRSPSEKEDHMNNQDAINDPHFRLQLLTVSDPKVRTNVMRYSKALRIALTGRKDDSPDLKLLIGMGFGLTDEADIEYQALTRADGLDRLYLRFDVDDACGPPDGLGLIRLEGDRAVLYGQCRLWSPASVGKPVIIFAHEGRVGHFTYQPGKTLTRVDRLPASDPTPGFRRADNRLAKLVASKLLQKVGEPVLRIGRG